MILAHQLYSSTNFPDYLLQSISIYAKSLLYPCPIILAGNFSSYFFWTDIGNYFPKFPFCIPQSSFFLHLCLLIQKFYPVPRI